jgi:hypothetical protein
MMVSSEGGSDDDIEAGEAGPLFAKNADVGEMIDDGSVEDGMDIGSEGGLAPPAWAVRAL